MPVPAARGVVFIHSAPQALCPHVEWALAGVLGQTAALAWAPQAAECGTWRAEVAWTGAAEVGARLASALAGWSRLRFEVTQEAAPGADGSRWSYLPTLGLHHTIIAANGDILVGEEQLRAAIDQARAHPAGLLPDLHRALGTDWDQALEPFRHAGQGAPVRWLHQVG
jgi:hypothetical protein